MLRLERLIEAAAMVWGPWKIDKANKRFSVRTSGPHYQFRAPGKGGRMTSYPNGGVDAYFVRDPADVKAIDLEIYHRNVKKAFGMVRRSIKDWNDIEAEHDMYKRMQQLKRKHPDEGWYEVG